MQRSKNAKRVLNDAGHWVVCFIAREKCWRQQWSRGQLAVSACREEGHGPLQHRCSFNNIYEDHGVVEKYFLGTNFVRRKCDERQWRVVSVKKYICSLEDNAKRSRKKFDNKSISQHWAFEEANDDATQPQSLSNISVIHCVTFLESGCSSNLLPINSCSVFVKWITSRRTWIPDGLLCTESKLHRTGSMIRSTIPIFLGPTRRMSSGRITRQVM